jgi:large subunit ribosomal protein L22
MEAQAVARYIRIAPRKVRIVLDLIRGKHVDEALSILKFTPKAASKILEKLVKSAAANAENNHDMNRDNLYIAKAYADQGPTLKRFRARAQGRAARIRKRTSHITIILMEKEG